MDSRSIFFLHWFRKIFLNVLLQHLDVILKYTENMVGIHISNLPQVKKELAMTVKNSTLLDLAF
jgi:hypothetical protein